MTRQESGRLGGRATFQRYGRPHMSAIGRRGFEATVARHWAGDRAAYRNWLIARGWHSVFDQLFHDFARDRFARGETIACVEFLVVAGKALEPIPF